MYFSETFSAKIYNQDRVDDLTTDFRYQHYIGRCLWELAFLGRLNAPNDTLDFLKIRDDLKQVVRSTAYVADLTRLPLQLFLACSESFATELIKCYSMGYLYNESLDDYSLAKTLVDAKIKEYTEHNYIHIDMYRLNIHLVEEERYFLVFSQKAHDMTNLQDIRALPVIVDDALDLLDIMDV